MDYTYFEVLYAVYRGISAPPRPHGGRTKAMKQVNSEENAGGLQNMMDIIEGLRNKRRMRCILLFSVPGFRKPINSTN